jgi:hypothetical protein
MGHFLAGILGKLFADEVRAWLPWIALQITRIAVWTLPENQRERYDEEWRAHLNEVPGALTKLVIACGFLCAAIKVSPRRRIVTAEIEFYGFVVLILPLILPLIGMLCALWALNSRRCYGVPLEVDLGNRDLHVTIDRIPLGLALRFALNPHVNLQSLDRSPYHYSLWRSSRLVELEDFLSTRVLHRRPFLSFGMAKSPFPLPWLNIKIMFP